MKLNDIDIDYKWAWSYCRIFNTFIYDVRLHKNCHFILLHVTLRVTLHLILIMYLFFVFFRSMYGLRPWMLSWSLPSSPVPPANNYLIRYTHKHKTRKFFLFWRLINTRMGTDILLNNKQGQIIYIYIYM